MGSDELVARLRDADRNSVQRMNGSRIFGEAADEIERLTAQLAEARASERAAVVAYLRKAADEADVKATRAETPESVRNWCATNMAALHLAKTIEAGEHLT